MNMQMDTNLVFRKRGGCPSTGQNLFTCLQIILHCYQVSIIYRVIKLLPWNQNLVI